MIIYNKLSYKSLFLDCDVCILVNNAAEFQQQSLTQMSPETLFRASNVNSHAPALLARFFLPQMLRKYDSMVSINFEITKQRGLLLL